DYTDVMDKNYSKWAKFYDGFMFFFPLWKKWIKSVIPFIKPAKILEISFGPGYLMTQYSKNTEYEIYGMDYNPEMVKLTKNKMKKLKHAAEIIQGNVENMPYDDAAFDTVICTMAYTGYPDGNKALNEIRRVLKDDGVFLLLDYDFPSNRNIFGYMFMKMMESAGDILKDIKTDLKTSGFSFEESEVGGFGSIHRFICKKI
ncbi:MAG: class I SAM-dependent methyltransferase, partial [Spirochaetes bacterium]|nr:class I SAM-dependent methyltransferase [Spirochaetota bacterium]